jgi:predicted ATPase
MSRYRAKRPFATSSLTAPFLRRVATLPDKIVAGQFPFTLPFLAGGELGLDFAKPVTIFVGENGTGKSTLLEAIAQHSGFNPQGGSRDNNYRYGDGAEETRLAPALRLTWLPKASRGFFFRAESFFNFASYIEETYRGDGRLTPWTERHLHHHSHGEVFLAMFERRFGTAENSLYLLDEPEAALSPERQLELLAAIAERVPTGRVQYVIATHSPLLMACPGADLLLFNHRGIQRAGLRDTPHFKLYDRFFRDPEGFLDEALRRIGEERRAAEIPDAAGTDVEP